MIQNCQHRLNANTFERIYEYMLDNHWAHRNSRWFFVNHWSTLWSWFRNRHSITPVKKWREDRLVNLKSYYNFRQGLRYEQTFEISQAWAEGGRRRRSPMLKKGKYFEGVALRLRQRSLKSLFLSKTNNWNNPSWPSVFPTQEFIKPLSYEKDF